MVFVGIVVLQQDLRLWVGFPNLPPLAVQKTLGNTPECGLQKTTVLPCRELVLLRYKLNSGVLHFDVTNHHVGKRRQVPASSHWGVFHSLIWPCDCSMTSCLSSWIVWPITMKHLRFQFLDRLSWTFETQTEPSIKLQQCVIPALFQTKNWHLGPLAVNPTYRASLGFIGFWTHPHWAGLVVLIRGPQAAQNAFLNSNPQSHGFSWQCSRDQSAEQDQGINSCRCVARRHRLIAWHDVTAQPN